MIILPDATRISSAGKFHHHHLGIALKQALAVYPKARVGPIEGGLLLKPSPPPVSAAKAFVPALPIVEKPGDD